MLIWKRITTRKGEGRSTAVLRYNPRTGRWRKAPAAPCRLPATGTQIARVGSGLMAACGANGQQIYSPRTNSWRILKTGPSPLNSREGSAIVWTGVSLLVWSGAVNRAGNPTPADGASLAVKG